MPSYTIKDKADWDLGEIWDYTSQRWSDDQADSYYNSLMDAFEKIAQNPESGRSYAHVLENCRAYKVKSHYIFYEIIDENHVEIIRILHGKMDMENRLTE